MKKTELVFILDRSGSMASLRSDVIDSINTVIKDQQALPGEATFTLVVFNSEQEVVFDNTPLQDVRLLDDSDFAPCGSTALCDAVCETVDRIGERLAATPEEERPEKVSVAIMTDGYENSSRKFSKTDVRQRIEHQKEVYNWEFLFLGANVDAFAEGASIGLDASMSIGYASDAEGVRSAAAALCRTYTASRMD